MDVTVLAKQSGPVMKTSAGFLTYEAGRQWVQFVGRAELLV